MPWLLYLLGASSPFSDLQLPIIDPFSRSYHFMRLALGPALLPCCPCLGGVVLSCGYFLLHDRVLFYCSLDSGARRTGRRHLGSLNIRCLYLMQKNNLSIFEELAGKTAWKKDPLRVRLTAARSIEETGLDPYHGGFLSPHGTPPHNKEIWSKVLLGEPKAEILMGKEGYDAKSSSVIASSKSQHPSDEEDRRIECTSNVLNVQVKGRGSLPEDGHDKLEKQSHNKGLNERVKADSKLFKTANLVTTEGNERNILHPGVSKLAITDSPSIEVHARPQKLGSVNLPAHNKGKNKRFHNKMVARHFDKGAFSHALREAPKVDILEIVNESNGSVDGRNVVDETPPTATLHHNEASTGVDLPISEKKTASVPTEQFSEEACNSTLRHSFSESSTSGKLGESSEGTAMPIDSVMSVNAADGSVKTPDGETVDSVVRKLNARSRWRRVTHTVTLVNHMAANIRSGSSDLIEDTAVDEILQQQAIQDDAGGVGAAAFEGAKTAARSRSHGRKGMEGLLVRQDRGLVTFVQDFYVACLKMPIGHFLIGVFMAPVALGLLFTPLYFLDVHGLSFNEMGPEGEATDSIVSATQRCLSFLHVFLYALSLSTTFGGSPVAARSPFCLLLANVNTLMAQFLFVFLSGAVFARMSQPSYPIRCAKKAIIKTDDLTPVLGIEQTESYKAFAVRLVLTGPSPCELVDAKISLTFRIFVKLPSGSVFCSTQDLEVVRPEVSYLRYGLMVRHIIDKKSPVYGHTKESLFEGDASFSLTVMGMERSSMQPIFHLEDYFVCDGDVIWEGDYVDFIHINDKGQRVLDHSQIDLLRPVKAVARASQAVSRMKNMSSENQNGPEIHNIAGQLNGNVRQAHRGLSIRNWLSQIHKRKLLKSKSVSFTRADW